MRTPRFILPLSFLLLVAVSLLVATSATGRSQAAPTNTKEPTITYVHPIKVGTILNGNKGTWSGTPPISYAWQWLRCNDNGEACGKIANATDTTYTVANADEGHTIRLDITASNSEGKATARANATSQVPKKAGAPVEVSGPQINGDAIVGETLTATTGTWQGNQPISYTFHWQSCTPALTSCPGNGETGNTYVVKGADIGLRIRVKVVAKNSQGQTSALSDPTGTVKSSGGGGGGTGGVAVDSLKAGDRLVVEGVHFSPNPVTSRSTPIQVTIQVTNQKGNPVRGAFVSVTSTPVVTSSPTPAQTDSNGTVAYTIHPEGDFPIKNGYSVQFYVKAYRQGDPTLAGVSGSRLVQVKTATS
jgi:hypothetical protein